MSDMYASPCDGTCCLDNDINGDQRCIGCLRLPSELQWDRLPEEKQVKILNRKYDEYFEDVETESTSVKTTTS